MGNTAEEYLKEKMKSDFNTRQFVSKLDAIDQHLLIQLVADFKLKNHGVIGDVSGIAFRDNLLRKADEMKESGIIWQSNKVYIEGIHCALDNMKTHIRLMFNKHYS